MRSLRIAARARGVRGDAARTDRSVRPGARSDARAEPLRGPWSRRLPSGVNFYRLLEARPALAQHLAAILSHAPALAEQLGRRPELLDGLIDASAFEPAHAADQLIRDFARADRAGDDYQLLLDRVRRRVNERRFALGVQLVVGKADPIDVAEGNSRVAEAAINVLAAATIAEFEASTAAFRGRSCSSSVSAGWAARR